MKICINKRLLILSFTFLFSFLLIFSFFFHENRNYFASADAEGSDVSNPSNSDFGIFTEGKYPFQYIHDQAVSDIDSINLLGNGFINSNGTSASKFDGWQYDINIVSAPRSAYISFPKLDTSKKYFLYLEPFLSTNFYFTLYNSKNSSQYINFTSWGLFGIEFDINENSPSIANLGLRVTNTDYVNYPSAHFPLHFTIGAFLIEFEDFFYYSSTIMSILYHDYQTFNDPDNDSPNSSYYLGYQSGLEAGYDKGYEEGLVQSNLNSYNKGYDAGYDIAKTTYYDEYYVQRYELGKDVGYEEGKSEGYDKGYSDAYDVGLNEGKSIGYNLGLSESTEVAFNQGYSEGKSEGYSNGFVSGKTLGYSSGYTEGSKVSGGGNSFMNLMAAVVDAPIQAFTNLFNFEILGFNMSSFFTALLTACIIMTIIKLIL